jgi:hypothetical protein
MSSEFNHPGAGLPVERVVVLENPISKNGARGNRQLQDLLEYSELPHVPVLTDRDPLETVGRLRDTLEPTDLLYIIGGDGTANSAVVPALESQALLLPTRSGNANDLAMSLYGRQPPWKTFANYMNDPETQTLAVRPIAVDIENGTSMERKYAINYTSFGYAALAAASLNQPWAHPRLKKVFDTLPVAIQNLARLPREGMLLAQAAMNATLFDYTTPDSKEPNIAVPAADITIVHSRRMAKVGRFNVEHTDPHVFMAVSPKNGVRAISTQFVKTMRGNMAGEYVSDFNFRATNTTDLYYHVDGEAFTVPEAARVSVSLARASLWLLAA